MKVKLLPALVLFVAIAVGLTFGLTQTTITFEKTFGGREDDKGYSVIETKDGGYVIVGFTKSFGEVKGDVYLIKIDQKGDKMWEKTFGGEELDFGKSVIETKDGGYIIAGTTFSFGSGGDDVYLIKTDSNGRKIWEKTFGGYGFDSGSSVIETTDGGYIVVGKTAPFLSNNFDVYLIKVDSNGNKVWERTFGGEGYDSGNSVIETKDGGYLIAGLTESFGMGKVELPHWLAKESQSLFLLGKADIYLVKTDSKGNKIWEKTFGGFRNDSAKCVIETKDGGYIIVGVTTSLGKDGTDIYLIKTDSLGNRIWEKTFGGKGNDDGRSVIETNDGGYLITGWTESFGKGRWDVYLIKTDSNGRKIWEKTFGGRKFDCGDSAIETKDGGYLIVGWTESFGAGKSDVYLIKTDSKGNVIK
jgi:hypothetical protein